MYMNLEENLHLGMERVAKAYTSISNGIAFRWKIHFKLKINVLQKHILSFGIDNINSSCVRFYSVPWQRLMKFTVFLCVHRILTHKMRSQCDIALCHRMENTKYYFLYEKSIYENPWQIFSCFLILALSFSFSFHFSTHFVTLFHPFCTRLCMCYVCMHAADEMNELERRWLVMFHVAVSNS